MSWQVLVTKHAEKQINKLPMYAAKELLTLMYDIRLNGPIRSNWRPFSKLKGNKNLYHCHIKSGSPTYVACWEVIDKKIKIVEVYYAGTHEKAPY